MGNSRVGLASSCGGDVAYTDFDKLFESYDDLVVDLGRCEGAKAVAELGGGANPIVADAQRWGFAQDRVVIDISAEELSKAEGDVQTRVADLCQPIAEGHNSYDLVFSRMLCEHLPDARTFHENCYNLLRPGGLAVHFFPTLYAAPFVANMLMPEGLARWLLSKVQPSRINPKRENFPAYYPGAPADTWAVRRFESVGFRVGSGPRPWDTVTTDGFHH